MDGYVTSVLIVLALITRTTALGALGLLYVHLARSTGLLVPPLRRHVATLIFLLVWVWVASIGDLLSIWPEGTYLVEYGARFIFIPNAVITYGVIHLFWRLYTLGKE